MELFATQGVARLQQVIDSVQPRVSNAMNDVLNSEFKEEKVKQALDRMAEGI